MGRPPKLSGLWLLWNCELGWAGSVRGVLLLRAGKLKNAWLMRPKQHDLLKGSERQEYGFGGMLSYLYVGVSQLSGYLSGAT